MAAAGQVQVSPKAEDFVFIERKEQSLDELHEELVRLTDEVALLQAGTRRREKFQEKFFELFIAFTVLVTPIAAAFAFNHLTDDHAWGDNCQKTAIRNCLECLKTSNSNLPDLLSASDECECEDAGEERTLLHLRQAIVFVLIAVSTFVGVPYYYYMMDDMCRTVDPEEADEDEAASEADPDEAEESKKVFSEGGEGDGGPQGSCRTAQESCSQID